MANKRELKKYINYVADELALETLFIANISPDVDLEKASDLFNQTLLVKREYTSRVSGCGGKDPKLVKSYFKKLRSDFKQAIEGIFDGFDNLHQAQ